MTRFAPQLNAQPQGRPEPAGPGEEFTPAPPVAPALLSRGWQAAAAKPGGLLELDDGQGRTAFGLRLFLPTPFRAEIMAGLADLAEELAGGEVFFNAAGEAELILDNEELAGEALRRARIMGLTAWESGPKPNQVSHCPGLLFCPRAAVDTLGPALALTSVLERRYFAWPAPLRISLSGCPWRCEADLTADLLIEGRFLRPPRLNHAYLNHHPDRTRLVANCPGQALSFKITAAGFEYFDSLELDEGKCLACGRCGIDQAGFTFQGGPEGTGWRLYLGGRRLPGARASYPELARENLANTPPHWPELSKAVGEIVEDWQIHAKPRERLAEYVERLGWPAWLRRLNWPVSPGLLDDREEKG